MKEKCMAEWNSKTDEEKEAMKNNMKDCWMKMKKNFGGCGNNWNFNGKPAWKEARAVCKKKPEDVIELIPGQTQIVDIEIFNDTHWPWKNGCTFGLADEQAEN